MGLLLVHFFDLYWFVTPFKHPRRIPYGNLWIEFSVVCLTVSLCSLPYRLLPLLPRLLRRPETPVSDVLEVK
jgi:hypothetical protein